MRECNKKRSNCVYSWEKNPHFFDLIFFKKLKAYIFYGSFKIFSF